MDHNGRKFDFPVLMHTLEGIDAVSRFCLLVTAFVDSLPLLKKIYPDQPSYRQEDLVSAILNTLYGVHGAIEDTSALRRLLQKADIQESSVMKRSFSPMTLVNTRHFNDEKAKNIKSLQVLIGRGVVKMTTAENIAGSGLNLSHLRTIFKRHGEDGLRDTCKNREGQPRVTSVKKTLETIIPKLVEYLTE